MGKLYELSVTDGAKPAHLYEGKETARSIMSFIEVADTRMDIMSVTIEMADGMIAVFLPVGKS